MCEFLCNFLRICIIDNRKNCDLEKWSRAVWLLAPRGTAAGSRGEFVCVRELFWPLTSKSVSVRSTAGVGAKHLLRSCHSQAGVVGLTWWLCADKGWHTHARTQHGTLVSLDVRQNAAKVDVVYWEMCSAVCVGAKRARMGRSGAARQPSSRPVALSALSQEALVLGCRLVFTI